MSGIRVETEVMERNGQIPKAFGRLSGQDSVKDRLVMGVVGLVQLHGWWSHWYRRGTWLSEVELGTALIWLRCDELFLCTVLLFPTPHLSRTERDYVIPLHFNCYQFFVLHFFLRV